jgi:hypothetical protein
LIQRVPEQASEEEFKTKAQPAREALEQAQGKASSAADRVLFRRLLAYFYGREKANFQQSAGRFRSLRQAMVRAQN